MCLGSFLFTSCFAMKGNYVLIVIFLLFTVVSSERKVICMLSCFLLLFSSVVLWTVGEILNRKKIKFTEHTVPITILWIIIFRNILDSLSYSLLNFSELSVNLMCTYFLFGHSDWIYSFIIILIIPLQKCPFDFAYSGKIFQRENITFLK